MKHQTGSRTSLKFKMIAMTMSLLALLGMSVAVLVQKLISHDKTVALDSFLGSANQVESAIAAQFFERYGDVQAFALNPGIQSSVREEIIGHLDNYAKLYGIYDLIMVVNDKGKL